VVEIDAAIAASDTAVEGLKNKNSFKYFAQDQGLGLFEIN
jgi:hypothetical protein